MRWSCYCDMSFGFNKCIVRGLYQFIFQSCERQIYVIFYWDKGFPSIACQVMHLSKMQTMIHNNLILAWNQCKIACIIDHLHTDLMLIWSLTVWGRSVGSLVLDWWLLWARSITGRQKLADTLRTVFTHLDDNKDRLARTPQVLSEVTWLMEMLAHLKRLLFKSQVYLFSSEPSILLNSRCAQVFSAACIISG